MSLNKVLLIGRLGRDPEVRYTQSGKAVANFTLATSERGKDGDERTEWHRIVVWDKQAETVGKYLSKGRQVFIEGRIQSRAWEDKEGNQRQTTEIVAMRVQFLGSRNDSEESSGGRPPQRQQRPPDRLRYPRVDPVHHDVVERAKLRERRQVCGERLAVEL